MYTSLTVLYSHRPQITRIATAVTSVDEGVFRRDIEGRWNECGATAAQTWCLAIDVSQSAVYGFQLLLAALRNCKQRRGGGCSFHAPYSLGTLVAILGFDRALVLCTSVSLEHEFSIAHVILCKLHVSVRKW